MAKDICIQDCAPAECSGSANGGKQGSSEWQGARAADDACDSEAGATGLMLSTNQTYESKHSNSTMHSPDENSSRRLEGGAGGSGHRSHDPDSAKVPSAAVQTAVLSKCTTERVGREQLHHQLQHYFLHNVGACSSVAGNISRFSGAGRDRLEDQEPCLGATTLSLLG